MISVWNAFVSRHPYGHLLQTEEWANFKSRFGWEEQFVSLGDEQDFQAGAHILYRWFPSRAIPLVSMAYTPKGPVVDWRNSDQVRQVLDCLVDSARRKRAIFLHIEPDLEENALPGLCAQLAEAGFAPAQRHIQPRRTFLLDISGDEEDILNRMKQKTRYNIRLAGRKGVVIRKGGPEDVAVFNQLMVNTGKRNQFGVHDPMYYETVFEILGDMAGLFIAEYNGQPLAAVMVFALGKTACYFYGASNDKERNRMPAYLLQWDAIRWARSRGCEQYDLWGVPDEDEETLENEFENRQEGLWGVYRFKRGFGGQLVRWIGGFDYVFNEPLYRLLGKIWN
ncbi:MAG: peptidoglycan bridge formation glycyltransferase FemA/FemB family protein [Anaerolineales bacterium]|nr:peptidoglycan bridge formation glycyltransferase FemA/FemB family protein [Anaerolineales bacterium]